VGEFDDSFGKGRRDFDNLVAESKERLLPREPQERSRFNKNAQAVL
jgi:hypothetical protein